MCIFKPFILCVKYVPLGKKILSSSSPLPIIRSTHGWARRYDVHLAGYPQTCTPCNVKKAYATKNRFDCRATFTPELARTVRFGPESWAVMEYYDYVRIELAIKNTIFMS